MDTQGNCTWIKPRGFSLTKFKISVTTKVSSLLILRLGTIAQQEWLNGLLGRKKLRVDLSPGK